MPSSVPVATPAAAAPQAGRWHSLLLLLGTGSLLGAGMPVSRVASEHGISALQFAAVPMLLAGAALALLAVRGSGRPGDGGRVARYGFINGSIGMAVPNALSFWFSAHVGAAFTSIAWTLPIVFTLAFAVMLGMERLTVRRALGVSAGVAGAATLVVSRLTGPVDTGAAVWQVAPVLAIPVLVAVANVYRKRAMPQGVSPVWLGAATLIGAAVSLLPVVLWQAATQGVAPNAAGLGWLLVQTLLLAGGYVLYFRLAAVADVVTFSLLGYAMLVTAMAGGLLWLGESLPPLAWPALALIVLGFVGVMPRRPS